MQEANGLAKLKKCPRCQEMFGCQHGRGEGGKCWCTLLWVPAAVLESLKQDYTDCLCKSCLLDIVECYRRAYHKISSRTLGESDRL